VIDCGAFFTPNPFSSRRPAVMRTGPFFELTTAALPQQLLRTLEDEVPDVEDLEWKLPRH
jgi:hypothetical protein